MITCGHKILRQLWDNCVKFRPRQLTMEGEGLFGSPFQRRPFQRICIFHRNIEEQLSESTEVKIEELYSTLYSEHCVWSGLSRNWDVKYCSLVLLHYLYISSLQMVKVLSSAAQQRYNMTSLMEAEIKHLLAQVEFRAKACSNCEIFFKRSF